MHAQPSKQLTEPITEVSLNDEVYYQGRVGTVVAMGDQFATIRFSDNSRQTLKVTDLHMRILGLIPERTTSTPIWIGKNGLRVPATVLSGAYIGVDGREYDDPGSVYDLDSGQCYATFGEAYPFGSTLGMDLLHYVKAGATIEPRSL